MGAASFLRLSCKALRGAVGGGVDLEFAPSFLVNNVLRLETTKKRRELWRIAKKKGKRLKMKKQAKQTKRASTRGQVRVEGVNPDDPRLKAKWAGYEKYEAMIDSLKIDAKWKAYLKDILYKVIIVGKRVVEVGKRILDAVLAAFRRHPDVAAALIVGTILSLLAANIPVIGWLLAPIIMAVNIMVSGVLLLSSGFQKAVLVMFDPLKDATRV